jgi:hypothetical protein
VRPAQYDDGLPEAAPSLRIPTPTAFLPGSPGKVAVLAERAARGEQLFHPADARGRHVSAGLGARPGYHCGQPAVDDMREPRIYRSHLHPELRERA